MAQAAYQKSVQIKATSSTAYVALPANSASLSLAGDLLDDTDFTTTGFRSRITGLKDWSVTGTLNYDVASAVITTMRNAWLNRTRLDVRYLPNGSKGFSGVVHVESMDFSADVAGLESVDFTLQADGSLSTA